MIKILAVLFMLIDHIGHFLYPDVIILRYIGRLALPLFAYCFAIGLIKTKNLDKYLNRIAILAIFTHLSLLLLGVYIPSILANFLLAGFAIRSGKPFFIISALCISHFLPGIFDYGAYGVCLVYLMFLHLDIFRIDGINQSPNYVPSLKSGLIIIFAQALLPILSGFAFSYIPQYQMISFLGVWIIQISGFSPLTRFFYASLLPRRFFYNFYYLHLVILATIYRLF